MINNLLMAAITPHLPIIIPEVGKSEIKKVENTIIAMNNLSEAVVKSDPETIVLITPHSIFDPYYFSVYTNDKLYGNFANFGAPQTEVAFENDLEFISIHEKVIEDHFKILNKIPPKTPLDHGSAVPLYFLQKAGYKGKIVVINYCALGSHEHLYFGKLIKETIAQLDRKFVLIASGDLSHRLSQSAPAGYNPQAYLFDQKIEGGISSGKYETIINIDPDLRRNAGECGYNSLMVAFGLLDLQPYNNKVLSYEAPFGVGYIVAAL